VVEVLKLDIELYRSPQLLEEHSAGIYHKPRHAIKILFVLLIARFPPGLIGQHVVLVVVEEYVIKLEQYL